LTVIDTKFMRDPRKLRAFVAHYVGDCHFNATEAAKAVGVKPANAGNQGWQWLQHPQVKKMIDEKLAEVHMSSDEALKLLADIARGDIGKFLNVAKDGTVSLDLSAKGATKLIKKVKQKKVTYSNSKFDREIETEEIELYSALDAIDKVLRVHGKYNDKLTLNPNAGNEKQPFAIPADKIAPSFANVYRDIVQKQHTEYIFKGGRGSAKSSFVSEVFIYLLINNPNVHGLALRQVADTLRDSVYAQLQWAIGILGLSDQFKCTLSPMEIEYIPTGQKIFFRGADDPGKIKSITPTFGYIGIVWFEELDQFHGQNAIRTIEQSIRGGDEIYYFKSFNPPPTKGNWANKYLEIPKANQYQHHSNYLGLPQNYLEDEEMRKVIPLEDMIQAYKSLAVPVEWLGKTWLDEAEHLKSTNLKAYENEYLGIATNDGGMIFDNIVIRPITDDEIYGALDEFGLRVGGFDNVLRGLDWGFYPDPASFGVMHFDAARRVLYIYGEGRYFKKSNQELFNILVDEGLIPKVEYEERKNKIVSYPDLIIADSAEPKSVGDFRAYGANCRGAEKGPESRKYSYKWLQGLKAIVIDNIRAPYHAERFLNAEFERTKDGEIISEYPSTNDDEIDDVRYGTNLIWRKRGE
jgi:PBSX family phage terminase large subunit